ncbi:MAG TPA: flagellar basal body P-ring formation chaperone FlgA [Luteitalea sp.]|nr:flagellar basal body P-ring formation chaperone FlgA [Luteitalea sp.]
MPDRTLAAVAGLWAVCLLATPAAAQSAPALDAAMAAARQAVAGAFGDDAVEVTLARPVLSMAPDAMAPTSAVPEPGSRSGGLVRFVLYAAGAEAPRRVGRLTADVRVVAAHVRARAAVAARVTPSPDMVDAVREDIGRQPFMALPTLAAVTTSTTRRSLMAGEVITTTALTVPAAVTSGDEVVTVARISGIEVRSRAIASQSGVPGDTVILVNPDSRKRLRGRVVGPALVEVLHGS